MLALIPQPIHDIEHNYVSNIIKHRLKEPEYFSLPSTPIMYTGGLYRSLGEQTYYSEGNFHRYVNRDTISQYYTRLSVRRAGSYLMVKVVFENPYISNLPELETWEIYSKMKRIATLSFNPRRPLFPSTILALVVLGIFLLC